jgi:type I restriction enzyme M protein
LIDAMVEVMDPQPGQSIHDPACGTGGFLLSAYDHMRQRNQPLDRAVEKRMREDGFSGFDIVPGVARLAAMNLYLHGLGAGEATPIHRADALAADPGRRWDVILTNPPFGRKQSARVFTGDGEAETEREDYERPDFPVTTGNKQLNFLQHVMTVLAPNGSAAVVLPDNVLFEGGAGEKIRRRLLEEFDCHTLLRLPTGIFYRQGVKANVLFFHARRRRTEPWTEALWVYDLRTNKRFTLKERPLGHADMADFIACARRSSRSRKDSERFKRYPYAELAARERLDLNLSWLREEGATDPANLPPPAEIAASIAEELETALARFRTVAARLV